MEAIFWKCEAHNNGLKKKRKLRTVIPGYGRFMRWEVKMVQRPSQLAKEGERG
jgi:hypothetical protein